LEFLLAKSFVKKEDEGIEEEKKGDEPAQEGEM